MDLGFNEYKNTFFQETGQYDSIHSPFQWELTGRNMAAMAVLGFVFFIITILCEQRFFIRCREERKRLNRLEQLRELQKREKELQLREEEMKRMRMNMAANPPRLPNQPNSAVTNPVPAPTTAAEQVDVKPNEADLLRAQRELTEAKQRESQQTQLIQQLQQQKDLLEKRDVFKIAESITLKHCNVSNST